MATCTETTKQWAVNIVQTTVLGVEAHHAECQHCGWKTERFDGKRGLKTAQRLAAKHGALHADAEYGDFYAAHRAKQALRKGKPYGR